MQLNKLKKIIPALMLAATALSLLPIGVPAVQAEDINSPTNTAGGGEITLPEGTGAAQGRIDSPSPIKQVDSTSCTIASENGLAMCVSNLVYYIMVGVFSGIAYICAFFFDIAIQLSLNSTTYALGFLTTSWTIVRDLSNMAFIFILIYVALTVMLTADNSQTIKTLAMVVVVALLVNFSFFFTRVAIDAGNLLALQFYNAIDGHAIGENPAGTGLDSTLSGGSKNAANWASGITAVASGGKTKDLTASIMDGIQVQNLVNTESFRNYADPQKNPNSSSMYIMITLSTIYFAVGIAFAILAGAFLYAGAKFMMRIVGLWFIIILSPLALASAALERTRPLFDKWLKQLVNFTFYPAVFLFMFFVLSRFMKELNVGADGKPGNFLSGVFASSAAGLSDGTFGFITILSAIANVGVRLGFVVAMMYLAVSAADMLAKVRGDITTPWAKSFSGWVGGGLGGGIIGAFGRQTLGRAGRWTGSEALANRTYDPRNIPLFGRVLTGFEPSTRAPHSKFGAVPIDYGTGSNKRVGLAPNPPAHAPAPNPQPPPPAQPAAPNNPQIPPPSGGGGGNGAGMRISDQNTGQASQGRWPGTTSRTRMGGPSVAPTAPSSEVHISQADIAGSAAAQRALQNMQKEAIAQNRPAVQQLYRQAAAEKIKDPNSVGTTHFEKQGEAIRTTSPGFEDQVASLKRQGEDIKQMVQNQSEQLRKTAAQVASELSPEALQQMRKLMRTVIRKENAETSKIVEAHRPPEPPKTPAGGALRPPRANDNNSDSEDLRRAA